MKRIVIAAIPLAAFFVLGAGVASADQSGMAGMHDQYVFKGRRCFTSHTHVGTGSLSRSKRQAIASAAQDWSAFTSFEYGSSWASWRVAVGKTVECERAGRGWLCEVQARPCLMRYGRRLRQAKR